MIGRIMKMTLVQEKSSESKKRTQLQTSIERRQKQLEDLMEKIEALRVDLDIIKHEYNVRIGGILLKDNQLDLEILQLRNLKELMKGGMTYQQAQKFEEDAFYSEILRMQEEQEKIEEERKMLDDIQDVSEDVMETIKTIWKKLIRRYHPDLVSDPEEKEKREALMKKINKAYTDHNVEALQAFESTQDITALDELSVGQLEEMLVKIENSLRNATGELLILQKSTWYEWKKKIERAKDKEGIKLDVFAELEQKLLDDIVKKIEIVQKLREEVHPTT